MESHLNACSGVKSLQKLSELMDALRSLDYVEAKGVEGKFQTAFKTLQFEAF